MRGRVPSGLAGLLPFSRADPPQLIVRGKVAPVGSRPGKTHGQVDRDLASEHLRLPNDTGLRTSARTECPAASATFGQGAIDADVQIWTTDGQPWDEATLTFADAPGPGAYQQSFHNASPDGIYRP